MLPQSWTWLTRDEEYNAEEHMAERLENALKSLKLDTYNGEYVVTVTVAQVSPDPDEPPEDD